MTNLDDLFENNRKWADEIKKRDPDFFTTLSRQQTPEYLWVGCSDSRVPANEIVGMLPGDIFVHRNIANLVIHTDINCLSVLQYAVEVLKVKHIIVCGHYGCGGVKAAMDNKARGLIDNWLRHVKDIYLRHQDRLNSIDNDGDRFDVLCELNVIEQVANISHVGIVQKAWLEGRELSIHGWIYRITDGILKDLKVSVTGLDKISKTHRLM